MGTSNGMKLCEDLAWRGLIKDKTFKENSWLDTPRTFYHGYDASSPSFTIGNLAALLLDKRLMDGGWKPIILLGGGTSLVGDPGGKSQERQLKAKDEIDANIEALHKQVDKLFQGEQFELVNNRDWLVDIKYLDFLRDTGKHFAMSELMQREFVTERLSTGISYAEFSYSLLQGYDYWYLFDKYGAELQVGGSDQWGNILSGVSLIRKKEAKEVHALSHPLVIDKTTGAKFGKSEAGAVWLDAEMTTPTQFYQFWMNLDDDEVESHLKIYTFLSRDEIEQVMAKHKADPGQRLAQKALAEAVTQIVHGDSGSQSSTASTRYLTGKASLDKITPAELEQLRAEIPVVKAKPGESLVDVLVAAGLAESKTEARRLLKDKAVYVNGKQVETELLAAADIDSGWALLRRGKAYKDSALIELDR